MAAGDYMVRATAADDAIRAFAVTTRELTEKARASNPIPRRMEPLAFRV